jgi:hypothetical protein
VTPDDRERDRERERDEQLSALFATQRREDEAAAPALEALLARSRTRRARAGVIPALALAASVAAVIAAAVLVLRSGAASTAAPSADAEQLAEWTSPTAFLLDTPGSELFSQIPSLEFEPVAGGAPAPSPTKGVSP